MTTNFKNNEKLFTQALDLVAGGVSSQMRPGSVIVDVAADHGGCFETTRTTTYEHPTYTIHGVVHYAVANMPGAVPKTATTALSNATLPYLFSIAEQGIVNE